MMEIEVIKCMEQNNTCMSYVIKNSGLKRKSEEIKREVELLEKEIVDLEAKKKKIQLCCVMFV